jgi:hypothetical protein
VRSAVFVDGDDDRAFLPAMSATACHQWRSQAHKAAREIVLEAEQVAFAPAAAARQVEDRVVVGPAPVDRAAVGLRLEGLVAAAHLESIRRRPQSPNGRSLYP